jgi:hypothetical protein
VLVLHSSFLIFFRRCSLFFRLAPLSLGARRVCSSVSCCRRRAEADSADADRRVRLLGGAQFYRRVEEPEP